MGSTVIIHARHCMLITDMTTTVLFLLKAIKGWCSSIAVPMRKTGVLSNFTARKLVGAIRHLRTPLFSPHSAVLSRI